MRGERAVHAFCFCQGVKKNTLARGSWLILSAWLAGFAYPNGAQSLTLSASSREDVERLTVTFEAGRPVMDVFRSGRRAVTLKASPADWMREPKAAAASFSGGLLVGFTPAKDGFELRLSTDKFGYIAEPGPGANQLSLTFFPDVTGAKWSLPPRDLPPMAMAAGEQPGSRNTADTGPQPVMPMAAAAPAPAPVREQQAGQGAPEPTVKDSSGADGRRSVNLQPVNQAGGQAGEQAGGQAAQAQLQERELQDQQAPVQPSVQGAAQPQPAAPKAETPKLSTAPYTMTAGIQWGGPENARVYTTKVPGQVSNVFAQAEQPQAEQAALQPQQQPAAQSVNQQAVNTPQAGVQPEPMAQAQAPVEPQAQPEAPGTEIAMQENAVQGDMPATDVTAEVPQDPEAAADGEGGPATIDVSGMYEKALRDFMNENYKEAIPGLEQLADLPEVEGQMREEVLHHLAQANYNLYREDLVSHFQQVVGPLERAVNYNPKSMRVPQALLQLGLAHLKVDNLPEAGAYFSILRSNFPGNENIPYIAHYYGDYWYGKKNWQKAADAYQEVVQYYPDSPVIRDAALGLARSLKELEYYEQAYLIADFISKRWPRYYIEDPEFLRLSGELANRLERFGQAKEELWNYYNMNPDATGNDIVLARIGDIYLRENKTEAARELYRKVADKYPDLEGGLVSKMRLAEEGIYDTPTLDEMYTVFDRPYNQRPEQIYKEIVNKYPHSPLAPLAQLKLSMWHMFNHRYWDAIQAAAQVEKLFPETHLKDRAVDVAVRAFTQGAKLMAGEQNYLRVVDIWDRQPILQQGQNGLDPDTRLLVATSLWKVDRPAEALALAGPLLTGAHGSDYGLAAMNLAMNIHLEGQDWQAMQELGEAVNGWNMPAEQRRQLDFSLALAEQNLGQSENARVRWARLAKDTELAKVQRGYALYYMAKASGEDSDLQQQYLYAQEALALFLEDGRDPGKIKDCLLMLTEVARKAGRLQKAMMWAKQYHAYVDESDDEWAASYFRMAELYNDLGNAKQRRVMLEELIDKSPSSLFGRMAASTLNSLTLEERMSGFSPTAMQ